MVRILCLLTHLGIIFRVTHFRGRNRVVERKEEYSLFCNKEYVPIYSKPWWLDAVCGANNWDVWLYKPNGIVEAAMPFYIENRNGYRYITKAPLTQNNGIIFKDISQYREAAKEKFEEKVINEACEYISSINVDVYEQQYQPEFTNWLPFFWNHYKAIVRYTYEIEDLTDMEKVWNNFDKNRRSKIKKGEKNANFIETTDYVQFYVEHEKIFTKQGLKCPFSMDLWERLVKSCVQNDAGKMTLAVTNDGTPTSVSFVVWDERKLYRLLGGGVPEFQNLDTYSAITWHEMKLAHEKNLIYDFEGSVIKRIAKVNREYGAIPKPYFRIRKVFSSDILKKEYHEEIEQF